MRARWLQALLAFSRGQAHIVSLSSQSNLRNCFQSLLMHSSPNLSSDEEGTFYTRSQEIKSQGYKNETALEPHTPTITPGPSASNVFHKRVPPHHLHQITAYHGLQHILLPDQEHAHVSIAVNRAHPNRKKNLYSSKDIRHSPCGTVSTYAGGLPP